MVVRALAAALLAVSVTAGLSGCVQEDYEKTLPPLIEAKVTGELSAEVRTGTTATPGLRTVSVSLTMEQAEVTSEDLNGVLDAIFETTSLPSVYTLGVRGYHREADGDLDCIDLSPAMTDLGLTQFASYPFGEDKCGNLLGDPDELPKWWADR